MSFLRAFFLLTMGILYARFAIEFSILYVHHGAQGVHLKYAIVCVVVALINFAIASEPLWRKGDDHE